MFWFLQLLHHKSCQQLTRLGAVLQAQGLSVEPILISSTTSIPELCTEPILSVKEPLSLIVFARQSSVIVKRARVCELVSWNMHEMRRRERRDGEQTGREDEFVLRFNLKTGEVKKNQNNTKQNDTSS